MQIHLFKSDESIVFGVRYSKHLFVDYECQLVFSFYKWDLEISWEQVFRRK